MPQLVTTILGSVLLAATATPAGTPEANERALRQAMGYSQRGMRSLEKGNGARAADDFRRALAQIPELPDAHAGLGHVAMRERRFEDALVAYRRAQEAYRRFAADRVELAQDRYSRSRDRLQVVEDAKNAVEQEQRRAQVRGGSITGGASPSEGRLQRQRLEYEQEINRLESQTMTVPAFEADASEPPAAYYFYEANALFNLKRNDEAIAAWKRAVALDPEYGVAYNNLAVAYWMTGRLEDAQASLTRADQLGFKVNPSFRADLEKSIAGQGSARGQH
jgi:tetratricopeptide (TPR) repeat protein